MIHNLETPNLNKFGCPSISSVNNKIYSANSFVSVEIEYGLKDGEACYNYDLNEKDMQLNNDMHTLIKSLIVLQYENNHIKYPDQTGYLNVATGIHTTGQLFSIAVSAHRNYPDSGLMRGKLTVSGRE